MILSSSHFDPDLPCWQDIQPLLNRISGPEFPNCSQLNTLLPGDLCSAGGHSIRFVASDQLDDDAYEHRIYTTGQVSTRAQSWHDLFNALIWMRFPCIKTAMNKLHYLSGAASKSGTRGPLRDAVTLFDECGVIVFSNRLELLRALAERRWSDAFQSINFRASVGLSICGHAMLEKYLAPYKAMTAKAVYVHVSNDLMNLPRPDLIQTLDRVISDQILNEQLLSKPARLSPLPLAGVPGWWPDNEQVNEDFYNDHAVFRPAPANLVAVPILEIQKHSYL